MYDKRFYVRINLQLHAITCPGVWLCTHGYLEATLKTLGYYFRTGAMEPRFPLFCHDTFIIEGHFKMVNSMEKLEWVLAAERVEITLWQHGRRLAVFSGKLTDVLRPTTGMPYFNCAHNINVQLLLKPTSAFPGIIAPKIELTTSIGVQDHLTNDANIHSNCSKHCSSNIHYTVPRFITNIPHRNRHSPNEQQKNNCFYYLEEKRHQKPVCHSKGGKAFCHNSNNPFFCPQGSCQKFKKVAPSNRCSSNCSCFTANTDTLTQKLIERRLSESSNSSFAFSQLSRYCASSLANEHQHNCTVCQSYRQTFGQ